MNQEAICIKIEGSNSNGALSPNNFDISELKEIIEAAEKLIHKEGKKRDYISSYSVREGSVEHLFTTTLLRKLELSTLITALAAGVMTIDQLDQRTAEGIERVQEMAIKRKYTIKLGVKDEAQMLHITPHTTYKRSKNLMTEAEDYLFGEIIDAGGAREASTNIRFRTARGIINISTSQDFLKSRPENILYKDFYAHVRFLQNPFTGETDAQSYQLVELVGREPLYKEEDVRRLARQASPIWEGIDTEEYLNEIRGYSYAQHS